MEGGGGGEVTLVAGFTAEVAATQRGLLSLVCPLVSDGMHFKSKIFCICKSNKII